MANGYFVAVLSPEQFALLKQNRIDTMAMDISGRKGIIIDARDIDNALGILGAIAERKATPYRGIEEIILMPMNASREPGAKEKEEDEMPETRQFSVCIKSWNGRDELKRPFIAAARKTLLPVVKKDIEIFVPHSGVMKPKKNGKFNVFIWSAAEDIRGHRVPDKLWNIPVECRNSEFSPSNKLGSKVISDGDYAVAEIIDNNLYIFHDICHYGTDNEKKIFARILEEAAKLLGRPKNGKELKDEKQKRLEETKRKYIEACAKRYDSQFKDLERNLNKWRQEIDINQQELIHILIGVDASQVTLECLDAYYKNGGEKVLSAIDKLSEAIGQIVKMDEKGQKNWRGEYAATKERELDNAKKILADWQRRAKNCEEKTARALQEYDRIEAQFNLLRSLKTDSADNKYGLEFDKLAAMEKVFDVEIIGNTLKVFTDTLLCEHPETHRFHELGKFEIRIPMNGKTDIRMYNLTRKIKADHYNDGWTETMHAPHIYPDGKPCLGNMTSAFPELLARYEFSIVAMLAIQFIEAVNEDDDNAMGVIERWPEVKTGAKTKKKR